MITVFDMETGEMMKRSATPAAPSRAVSSMITDRRTAEPALALQVLETNRPAARMPPDLALLDRAEILARFR
jgi:hypothetical protein